MTTRFLFVHLKGRRLLVALAILLTFVQVGTAILSAFPLKWILDKIVHHQDPAVPLFGSFITLLDHYGTRNGVSDAEAHTQLAVILFAVIALIVLEVIGAIATYVQLHIAAVVGQEIGSRLRMKLFAHIEHLPLGWHVTQRTGEIVQRITGNVTDVEKLVTDGLVDLLSGVLTLVGVVLVMFVLNWQFTVMSMFVMPFLFVIVFFYTRWIKRASKTRAKAAGQVAQVASEDFNAIAELKVFTLEKWAHDQFGTRVEAQRASGTRGGRRQAEFAPTVELFTVVSFVSILSAGCWIAAGHGHQFQALFVSIPTATLTIGTLTVFLAYSKLLYQPMRNLSKLMLVASNGTSAIERIQEILDHPRETQAPDSPYGGPTELAGHIVYRGVMFSYTEGRPVLHGIDLDIPVGRRLALVGLSGSGKTTLVRLLPRFYEPSEGSISIDGVDVRDYPLDLLRNNISLVLQDSVLFEGTVRDNITLGRPQATDEQVISAAQQAQIYDTIMDLPDGMNAEVCEQGKNFSSGQRQRLAIARAILRDAPILILDEPTANLDVEAEADVMRAIERLTAKRTVIVISHRLSTLGHVDQIAVLDAGRIVERGTYDELKRAGGAFARLLAEQNRYAAEPVSIGSPGAKRPPRPTARPRSRASTDATTNGATTGRRAPASTNGSAPTRAKRAPASSNGSAPTRAKRAPASSNGSAPTRAKRASPSDNGTAPDRADATEPSSNGQTPSRGRNTRSVAGNGSKPRPTRARSAPVVQEEEAEATTS